jgi:hypothetical protein
MLPFWYVVLYNANAWSSSKLKKSHILKWNDEINLTWLKFNSMNMDKDTHSISWRLLIVCLNIPSTIPNLGGLAWLKHIIYIPSPSLDDGTIIIYLFPRNIHYLILQFHTSHQRFKHSCLWNPFLSPKDLFRPMRPWMAQGGELQLGLEEKWFLGSWNCLAYWISRAEIQLWEAPSSGCTTWKWSC